MPVLQTPSTRRVIGLTFARLLPAALLAVCGWAVAVLAAEPESPPPADDAAKKKTEWRAFVDRQTADYTMFVGKDNPTRLDPAKPLLRWSNQARVTHTEACTYLWTHKGRPVAVACFYTMNRPQDPPLFAHDFQSLSRDAFAMERLGSKLWQPATPGVEYRPVPEATAPEPSAPGRLRQMKRLAGQFTARLAGWRPDSGDREELRLLPQPLYRYQTDEAEVFDGGVFFFVQGVDPEVVLLLEAVRSNGASQWRYAFAPRSSGALEGRHQGKQVWSVPRRSNTTDPTQMQFAVVVRPRQ